MKGNSGIQIKIAFSSPVCISENNNQKKAKLTSIAD